VITKADVDLAGKIPECVDKIKKIRMEQLLITKEEEERREKWSKDFYARQGSIRAAEAELNRAGEAQARIYREVPMELRQALENAGVSQRAHEDVVVMARQGAMSAQEFYERRVQESRSPGVPNPITKAEGEALMDEVILKKGTLKEAERVKRDLDARVTKAQAEVDVALKKIKSAAR
jgi:hypothetical protein